MLHKAIQEAREGDLEGLRVLQVSGGLVPGIADDQGATPVHHAARAGQMECLRFLVREANFKGNARARNGATAAHDAAATGHVQELQWLLGHAECRLEVRNRNRLCLRDGKCVQCVQCMRASCYTVFLLVMANKSRVHTDAVLGFFWFTSLPLLY